MNGKTLKGILKSIEVADPNKIGECILVDNEGIQGYIPLEDIIEWDKSGSICKPIDKEELLSELEEESSYHLDSFAIYEGNAEYNIGIQAYESLKSGTVLSLVVFGENPTLMGVNQVITSFWFKSREHYLRWLRQDRYVYHTHLSDNFEAYVYARINSHQIDIIVYENGREVSFIKTNYNINKSDKNLKEFVVAEVDKLNLVVHE